MSAITTHVLDVASGKPAGGIAVHLEKRNENLWDEIASGATDSDGRCRSLSSDAPEGVYRLRFDTADYFQGLGRTSIYPEIYITFHCRGAEHYHLPLLLSDNGYTTYRGS